MDKKKKIEIQYLIWIKLQNKKEGHIENKTTNTQRTRETVKIQFYLFEN